MCVIHFYFIVEENVEFVAISDYVAKSDDELMFLKGEKITLIRKESADVWYGECEGIEGSFPANRVKPADKPRLVDNTTRT